MNFGEIGFDMNRQEHLSVSQSAYLLKRWTKYSIYTESASWNRTDNPNDNLYMSNSIYLYDYVSVSRDYYNNLIYTASVANSVTGSPGSDVSTTPPTWMHFQNTFKDSPNAITNNWKQPFVLVGNIFRYGPYSDQFVTVPPPYNIDDGQYFELVNGYPRNHLVHKRALFSLFRETTYGIETGQIVSGLYCRCRQTVDSTIGETGLEDGSLPVQTTTVGNLNLIQGSNVINR